MGYIHQETKHWLRTQWQIAVLTRLKALKARGILVEIGSGPHDPKRQYALASGKR